MKKTSVVPQILLDWVLISIGVLGSVYCLTTVKDFGLPMPVLVPILVPVLALLFCFLFQGKLGKYYALGVLGLLVFCGWLFREDLIAGLRSLWAVLINVYEKGYGSSVSWLKYLRVSEPWEPEAVGGGVVALAVLETYLCALSVRLWKRTTPAALSILPGVGACFVLTNTLPANLPLLAVAFSILVQAFSQSARRRHTGEHTRAVLCGALVSAALLGLLLLFLPEQKNYESPITWEQLDKLLDNWQNERIEQGNVSAGLTGNPDAVDLTRLDDLPNRPIPKLYVYSAATAYLYLRGSSYMGFDGSSWSRGSVWEGGTEAAFPYLSRNDGWNLTVETLSAEPTVFTTYQLSRLPSSGAVVGDAYVENTDEVLRYNMQFLTDPEPVAYDAAYDAWVRENCLEVPDQTRAAVLAWWEAQGGETVDWSAPEMDFSYTQADGTEVVVNFSYSGSVMDADGGAAVLNYAQQVAAKVSQTASYSRAPARVPEGRDFCDWFLNEAEEGYCVHYATACTALLRALGIPARYVSGYVCQAEGGERTRVTNLQNHAWVEIWTGGRWVVVEPTPDDATEFSGLLNPNGENAEASTEAPATTEAEGTVPPFTKPKPSESEESSETEPSQTTEPRGGAGGSKPSEPRDLTALWVFLGIVGFFLLVIGRRELTLWILDRRLVRAKGNDKARLLYRRILRLHKLGGGPVPPEAAELAQKAAFSHHELDDTELYFLRQVYEQKRSRLAISGFWRRIWCKYVLAVI